MNVLNVSVKTCTRTLFLTDWPSQKLNTRKHPPLEATGETSKPNVPPHREQEQECMKTLQASSICELPVPSSVQHGNVPWETKSKNIYLTLCHAICVHIQE